MNYTIFGLVIVMAMNFISIPVAYAESDRPKISCSKDQKEEHSFAACLAVSGITCTAAVKLSGSDEFLKRFAQRAACRSLVTYYQGMNLTEEEKEGRMLATGARTAGDLIENVGGGLGFIGKLFYEGMGVITDHAVFESCRKRFEDKCYRNYLTWKGRDADKIIREEAEAKARQKEKQKKLLSHFGDDKGSIISASLSPNGKYLATSIAKRAYKREKFDFDRIDIWDIRQKKIIRTFRDKRYKPLAVRFLGNDKIISTKHLRVWNIRTGRSRIFSGTKTCGLRNAQNKWGYRSFSSLSLSPDKKSVVVICQKRIASLSETPVISIWDIRSGRRKCSMMIFPKPGEAQSYPERVHTVAYSPDGRYIISGGVYDKDYTPGKIPLTLWDSKRCKKVRSYKVFKKDVLTVDFAPDGKTFLTQSYDITRVVNVKTGKSLGGIQTSSISQSGFLPDGKHYFVAMMNGTINIYTLDHKKIKSFNSGRKDLYTLVFTKDGKTFFTGHGEGGSIKHWNLAGTR